MENLPINTAQAPTLKLLEIKREVLRRAAEKGDTQLASQIRRDIEEIEKELKWMQ